jgi:hypothetical protein
MNAKKKMKDMAKHTSSNKGSVNYETARRMKHGSSTSDIMERIDKRK